MSGGAEERRAEAFKIKMAFDALIASLPDHSGHWPVEHYVYLIADLSVQFDRLAALFMPPGAAGTPFAWPHCVKCGSSAWMPVIDGNGLYRCSVGDCGTLLLPGRAVGDEDAGREAKPEWVTAIENEVEHALSKHGRDPWGRHELHGVLEEEYDELKRTIYADEPTERVLKEGIECCAVIVRYILTGDRYRGPHPAIPLRSPSPSGEQKA